MSLLVQVLKDPHTIKNLDDAQFDILTCQARSSSLLGRLYYLFTVHNLLSDIPHYVLWHYQAAAQITDRLKKNALREVQELSKALNERGIKTTFLKGAAYQVSGIDCHHGRLMSDIDILVDKMHLDTVKGLLLKFGWITTPMDDYDQQYYRQWMHEIPPLRHIERNTTLDIHHNILPLTNKNSPIASKLNTRVVNHEWCAEINVLIPTDMIIHSAVHLFTESEFNHALRDLSDLHLLITEFSINNSEFAIQLIERANELGLSRYLWLALTLVKQVFDTEFEYSVIEKLKYKPPTKLHKNILLFSYTQVFLPDHRSCKTWKVGIATEILFWRSHLIKMPLRILVPHLIKKSYKRIKESGKRDLKENKAL